MDNTHAAITVGQPVHELHIMHGPLMTGKALWQSLGYQTGAAFRQAARRGTLPIATFRLPNRRGRFAKTESVAKWLTQVVTSAVSGKEVT